MAHHSKERTILHCRVNVVIDPKRIIKSLRKKTSEEVRKETKTRGKCSEDRVHQIRRIVDVNQDKSHN